MVQGLHLAVVMSLLVAVGAWVWSEPLMKALGAGPEVVGPGAMYLRIVGLGSLPMLLSMLLGSSLRGAGQVRLPFRAMILANVVNAILDPIMIFGLAGLPRMGVAGSAAATVVGRVVGMTVMAASLMPPAGVEVRSAAGRAVARLRLHRRDLLPDVRMALEIVRMGIFASGRMMVQNISQIILMRIVAGFGTAAVAAFGIGLRLQMLVFAPSMGFGVSAATLVGQYFGAGDPARARRAAWTAVTGAFVVAGVIAMGVGSAAAPAVRLFNADTAVIHTGAQMLRWMCLGFPFIAMMFVLGSGMGGGGDTFSPLITVALNSFGIRLPGVWWFSRGVHGVLGVWVALAVSSVTGALLSLIFFERGRWRRTGHRIRRVVFSEGPGLSR